MSRADDVKRARKFVLGPLLNTNSTDEDIEAVYTLAAVRAEALEEAAKVCEDTDVSSLDDAADRIRTLKETP